MPKRIELKRSELDQIAGLYRTKVPVICIAEQYGISPRTVQRRLNQDGVWRKNQYPKRKRKYSLNESFFSTINSERKAYWLGFIMADGCVMIDNYNRSYLDVRLAVKDAGHLIAMSFDLGSNQPVKYYKNNTYKNNTLAAATFCSRDLVNDLIDCGVIPRKTLLLRWP